MDDGHDIDGDGDKDDGDDVAASYRPDACMAVSASAVLASLAERQVMKLLRLTGDTGDGQVM